LAFSLQSKVMGLWNYRMVMESRSITLGFTA
jgi:hypothetical protein